MTIKTVMRRMVNLLPDDIGRVAMNVYRSQTHWAHPSLKGTGSVQDLYYWTSEDNVDTMLLLQNYFSVFYPELNTDTYGSINLFDDAGGLLGEKRFPLLKWASVKLMISSLLIEFGVPDNVRFGTLECHLEVPNAVMAESQGNYFFDRFYIGYATSLGQPAFVHGVDRTHIYREDKPKSFSWYEKSNDDQWAPEIPIDIHDYKKLNVIMINRTNSKSTTTLEISDRNDRSKQWKALIEPHGVHRFELNRSNTDELDPQELRLKIIGMASKSGRPVLFKEFDNGSISVMHC